MTKRKLFGLFLFAGAMTVLSAAAGMAAGWTTNNNGYQVYVNDNGETVTNSWIKAEENGNTIWYYATSNGTLRSGGWQKVGDIYYYFDDDAVMQTGWIDDYTYWCDESGAMRTGWRYLPIPEEFAGYGEEYVSGSSAWFYFSPANGEKFKSDDSNVKAKKVNGTTYGFDSNGVMVTGWAKTEDTTPELAGYEYFAEKSDTHFTLGQRVQGTWYTTVGPKDDDDRYNNTGDLATGDVEYFYFKSNGHPLVGTKDVCLVQKINNKVFLFNHYGNPATGLNYGSKTPETTTVDEADVYYCGESKSNSSAVAGKKITITDDSGERITIELLSSAKGVSGTRNGYLYYQGKLQKAETGTKYQIALVDGKSYVVNQSGQIQKNKTRLIDADGNKFSTNSDGTLKEVLDGNAPGYLEVTGPEIDIDERL